MSEGRAWKRWLGRGLAGVVLCCVILVVYTVRCVRSDMAKFPLLVEDARVGGRILFRGVDVYPGWGKVLWKGRDVLVEAGKIRGIGARQTIKAEGAHVVEGAGHTLMPGLVDTHVHLSGSGSAPGHFVFWNEQHNLHAHLRAGVTTVFDLGGQASASMAMRDKVRSGQWLGPRIFFTDGPISSPGSHPAPAGSKLLPWPLGWFAPLLLTTIQTPADAPKIVAGLQKKQVDYVKMVVDQLPPGSPEMGESLVRALVRAAKAKGMRVFIHIGSAQNALVAARAGADVLAHGVYRDALTEAQAREIAKAGIRMIPTLAAFERTAELAEGKMRLEPMERMMHPSVLWEPILGEKGKSFAKVPVLREFAEGLLRARKHWHENIRLLHRAGVPIWVGTDSALPGVYPGSAYHRELQALSKVGIPNDALLEAATSGASRLLEKHPRYGKVEVGMAADLIMIEGDPLRDIRAVEKLKVVMRAGKKLRFLEGVK